MRFLKISGRLEGFLARLDYSGLKDPFRTSQVTVVYKNCRSSVPEVAVAYLNRPSDSIEPIFPYEAKEFTGGTATKMIFVSKEELVIVMVHSSNPTDAAFILRKVVELIQSTD